MAKRVDTGLPDVVKIDGAEIGKLVKHARQVKQVVGFLGAPGCGKSANVRQAAEMKQAADMKLNFIENPTMEDWENPANYCFGVVNSASMENVDVTGMPCISEREGKLPVTRYTMTELIPVVGCGVIFLDEFPNAPSHIQNAFQRIILDHAVGGRKMSDNIQIVIAGNRPQDNSGVYKIPTALRNRVQWYEVGDMSIKDWLKIMTSISRPIDSRLAGWLLSIGEKYGNTFNPNDDHYAFATKRSLEKASESIKGVTDYALMRLLVGGWIGDNAGAEFVDFLKLSEKVDIDDLLKHPDKIKKYEDEMGTLFSVCVALIDKVSDQKTANSVFSVMTNITLSEFGVFILNGLMNKLPESKVKAIIAGSPDGEKLMGKYMSILI